jgi:hypothetical protein
MTPADLQAATARVGDTGDLTGPRGNPQAKLPQLPPLRSSMTLRMISSSENRGAKPIAERTRSSDGTRLGKSSNCCP